MASASGASTNAGCLLPRERRGGAEGVICGSVSSNRREALLTAAEAETREPAIRRANSTVSQVFHSRKCGPEVVSTSHGTSACREELSGEVMANSN